MTTTNNVKRFSLPWAADRQIPPDTPDAGTGRTVDLGRCSGADHGRRPGPPTAGSSSAAKKADKKEAQRREQAESAAHAATRWHHERKWKFASRLGFYDPAAPGVESSTRQMEFSHMAIASPPTSHRGLVFGVDAGSGWMIVHDPSPPTATTSNPRTCATSVTSGRASPRP